MEHVVYLILRKQPPDPAHYAYLEHLVTQGDVRRFASATMISLGMANSVCSSLRERFLGALAWYRYFAGD